MSTPPSRPRAKPLTPDLGAQTTAQDRGRILFKLADKIRQNTAHLADIESRNSGKPIVEAEYDVTQRRHLL